MADSPAAPALALQDVTCSFAARGGRDAYTAVREASFAVADGEFVALVGPTGCGKSTLLNLAAGLLAPTRGSVSVFGAPLAGINATAGYLFQADALFPWRNALDNVVAGLQFRGVTGAQASERGMQWLRRVGLGARPGRVIVVPKQGGRAGGQVLAPPEHCNHPRR